MKTTVTLGLAIVLTAAGCQGQPPKTDAPADGYETSLTGYVSKTYDGDFDLTVAATKASLQKLGFNISEETGALFEKKFDVESEDHTSVVIKVAAVTKSTTRLSVKVGYLLGNRDAAQRIHSEIDGEIAARHQEAAEQRTRWGHTVGVPAPPQPSPPARPSPASARAAAATAAATPLPPSPSPHRLKW